MQYRALTQVLQGMRYFRISSSRGFGAPMCMKMIAIQELQKRQGEERIAATTSTKI
jgi:hypothetical protein